MLTKLLYFGSNKKFIPLSIPPGCRPTRIYTHQKQPPDISPGIVDKGGSYTPPPLF